MRVTNYYKLWFDESDPLAATCNEAELKSISEYFIYSPKPVEDWPEKITFHSKGEHFQDYLFTTVVDWILVSERVKQILEKLGIDGVQFLPIRVVREETSEEILDYYVLHVWKQISALDENHTIYREPKNERYPQLNIIKVALRREAIKDTEVFRLRERNVSVYVSRRVKERMEHERMTGFKWIPILSV